VWGTVAPGFGCLPAARQKRAAEVFVFQHSGVRQRVP
jgi:hypothetical protein